MVFPNLPIRYYNDIRNELQTGDILLCSGESLCSQLIRKSTGSCWSHVAMVLRLEEIGRVMLLESIEDQGIRIVPLSNYVHDYEGTAKGYPGRLALARHREFELKATPEGLKQMSQFAFDRCARPYDSVEKGRIRARIVGGGLGFDRAETGRDRECICSEYVYECFWILGIDIAFDRQGIVAPVDFARDKKVALLWELNVEQG